jgi:hypothetical protein
MEFELVPPTALGGPGRGSMDSMRISQDGNEGKEGLRAESPVMIGSFGRSTSPLSPDAASILSRQMSMDSQASAETHRQRELKWISAMSSIPATQMRKSKKIRKLLLEGVPSSVRYVVWANLTNIKARRMEGVYTKLGKRGRVPASHEIERDLQRFFPDNEKFREPTGPLATVLQAYLTMVPDVQYHPGLTLIAGYLLQQGPEEDAFWIFVSVMEEHLREYFAMVPVRLEVDSALFSKALEANDPALAKKLMGQLGLESQSICRPW